MTGWEYLNRLGPGWPSERQWVTIGIYAMGMTMLTMGAVDKTLWNVELFKVIIQGVVLSGFINMVLAFHFAANKTDETRGEIDKSRADTSGKMADAMKSLAESAGTPAEPDVILKPGETAQAEEPKP